MITERHLFGPGPSNPYPEATNALARPLLGHLDPAFLTIMDEACEMLRTVWGTTNARTLPISATGSAGGGGRSTTAFSGVVTTATRDPDRTGIFTGSSGTA